MSQFKFVTGEIIEVHEEDVARLLRKDSRYSEILESLPDEEPIEVETKKSRKKGGK